MYTPKILITALAGIYFAQPALAQQAPAEADWFSHSGALELIASRSDAAGEDYSLVARGGYAATVRLGGRFTVQGLATLWPMHTDESNTLLNGEGLFAEQLKVHYAGDGYSLYVGKFDPAFGSAFNLAPGIYGKEIGQSYQTVEKLGIGGDLDLSASLLRASPGAHVLSLAAFKSDRSQLSRSLGYERPRLRKEDGGPANTSGLNSWAVSLDGEVPNGFGYTVGMRSQAGGLEDEATERGYVVGVHFAPKPEETLTLGWLAEIASFENANGFQGARKQSYTFGATLGVSGWSASMNLSGDRTNELAGDSQQRWELSLGRGVGPGLTLDAGIEFVKDASSTASIAAVRLSYAFGAA